MEKFEKEIKKLIKRVEGVKNTFEDIREGCEYNTTHKYSLQTCFHPDGSDTCAFHMCPYLGA